MWSLFQKLFPLNRNFSSSDYDKAIAVLQSYLPFQVIEFPFHENFNGWEIPPKWDLVKGEIYFKGKKIFEVNHPLKIIGLSESFSGKVSLKELKEHLHYDHRYDDAIPYHFRQSYRPWDRTWGFCVSRNFYNSLEEGDYEVCIETEESEGPLKVLEYQLPGKTPVTYAFVAHLDHPGMANDDLAGVVVGVELFKRLSQRQHKFSYKLLLVQEIIGSEFYLGREKERHAPVVEACFLEMLGSKTPLALQHSRTSSSQLELELKKIAKETHDFRSGAFKSIICNDEAIWESYGIPMCSLSRFPYPEYHSDKDNLSIISPESLEESVSLLERLIEKLERKTMVKKNFSGNICLSHPMYNLYIDEGEVAFGSKKGEREKKMRKLMDLIPTLDKEISIEEIAQEVDLSSNDVLTYLAKWEEKKLVTLI
ncbi:MAG: DUF4910 domain-containing protein [Chlamydiales bacterium]|nr:DUF4910 domain-containing protein [Chlamydiales bacterium]NCF70617.1 DUF4910 domain-containing protein [Chlamydiales bacterium]